jgi:hypothetical protein
MAAIGDITKQRKRRELGDPELTHRHQTALVGQVSRQIDTVSNPARLGRWRRVCVCVCVCWWGGTERESAIIVISSKLLSRHHHLKTSGLIIII